MGTYNLSKEIHTNSSSLLMPTASEKQSEPEAIVAAAEEAIPKETAKRKVPERIIPAKVGIKKKKKGNRWNKRQIKTKLLKQANEENVQSKNIPKCSDDTLLGSNESVAMESTGMVAISKVQKE